MKSKIVVILITISLAVIFGFNNKSRSNIKPQKDNAQKPNIVIIVSDDQSFWDGNEGKWAVREGTYKLVKNSQGVLELYDLNNDIGESNNIISSQRTKAGHLEKNYIKWRNSMGKPMSKN